MTKEGIKSEIFNVCSNMDHSVREIYHVIANYMGKNIVPKYNKSKDFWNKYPELYTGALLLKKEVLEKEVNKFALGENSKARAIGWKPRVGIEEGLKRSVDYAVKILSKGLE